MPSATKKRPPMEAEPGEGKAHEQGESPEEEVREGSESGEMPRARGNRKRSAKGAKRTKAPMDSDCGCGGGKGKSCSCKDSDCGYSKKMDSALTPQEYLAACDLGIQGRSRSYIRTRLTVMDSLTPATVQFRTDKKCGASGIADNKQCRSGAGGGAAPRKMSTGKRVVSGVLGGMSALSAAGNAVGAVRAARRGQGTLAYIHGAQALGQGLASRQYFKGNIRKGIASEFAGTGLAAGGVALNELARTPGAKNAARRAGEAAGGLYARARSAVGRPRTVSGQSVGSSTPGRRRATVGQQAYRAAKGASYAAGRAAGTVARMGRRRGRAVPYGTGGALARRRGDAVWADGFEPRTDKKCGASGIADNKQCRAGAGGAAQRPQSTRRRIAGTVLGTLSAGNAGVNAITSARAFSRGNYAQGVTSGIGAVTEGLAARSFYKGKFKRGFATSIGGSVGALGAGLATHAAHRRLRNR